MPHRSLMEALSLMTLAALALVLFYTASTVLASVDHQLNHIEAISDLLLVKKAFELAADGYEVVLFIPEELDATIVVHKHCITLLGWNVSSIAAHPTILEPGSWYVVRYTKGFVEVEAAK